MVDNKNAGGIHQVPWMGGTYEGQLRYGVPEGKGKLTLPDGAGHEGEWIEGRPHGQGTTLYPSGAAYQGEFVKGKPEGFGRYRSPDGKVVAGYWKENKLLRAAEQEETLRAAAVKKPKRDIIVIENMTFRYSSGKGVFNLNFSVKDGEVFGFLGPNGAGKTTAIRNLLGFTRPLEGTCLIGGYDCWADAALIQEELGYLPGEMAFFNEMSGAQFLDLIADLRGKRRNKRRNELIKRFELDPSGRIRRMSKGMKQKLGIVAAFMHDPSVYVLDEPTSGLDPLMQNNFIGLILEEKERGKTILMSSHNFEEVYRTCDRAGIISEGRLVAIEDVHSLKSSQRKAYLVTLGRREDLEHLRSSGLEIGQVHRNTVEVFVSGSYDLFLAALAKCEVLGLDVVSQSLEEVFLKYYGQEAAQ